MFILLDWSQFVAIATNWAGTKKQDVCVIFFFFYWVVWSIFGQDSLFHIASVYPAAKVGT